MSFINGLWVEPIKIVIEKENIRSSQINMQYVMGRSIGSTFRVTYLVSINPSTIMSKNLTNQNVNMNSLKESIINKIDAFDRPYMKLINFSTSKAIFELDTIKWMNDAFKTVIPNNRLTKFEQIFKLKKQVPKMISLSVARSDFEKFLLRQFDNYMEKHRKNKSWFQKFLPRDITGKIRLKIATMFDYEYDWQYNKIIARLKPVYVMGILFATGAIVSSKQQKLVNIDFEKSVKRRARNFNRKKWTNFIKQKYI